MIRDDQLSPAGRQHGLAVHTKRHKAETAHAQHEEPESKMHEIMDALLAPQAPGRRQRNDRNDCVRQDDAAGGESGIGEGRRRQAPKVIEALSHGATSRCDRGRPRRPRVRRKGGTGGTRAPDRLHPVRPDAAAASC